MIRHDSRGGRRPGIKEHAEANADWLAKLSGKQGRGGDFKKKWEEDDLRDEGMITHVRCLVMKHE